ncbi:hypothetical protein HETIRDRAFT_411938 [Heterobasidion irregulare TC 32-1]|uniref:Uncharacterized protein n=1 Tax=Heterobasidion irregulare (strain TC 32-1) TaxID=747525 RepID=W4JT30_HETIT|nr:uncharacterized protein HETIRDRAFT_411938 [Heterobasidion irregulare TC 32-1]ETW76614.1 hypothetical protein HETIRDRAFT_411938 [Heterobasidion irregulare TC 32-1]
MEKRSEGNEDPPESSDAPSSKGSIFKDRNPRRRGARTTTTESPVRTRTRYQTRIETAQPAAVQPSASVPSAPASFLTPASPSPPAPDFPGEPSTTSFTPPLFYPSSPSTDGHVDEATTSADDALGSSSKPIKARTPSGKAKAKETEKAKAKAKGKEKGKGKGTEKEKRMEKGKGKERAR